MHSKRFIGLAAMCAATVLTACGGGGSNVAWTPSAPTVRASNAPAPSAPQAHATKASFSLHIPARGKATLAVTRKGKGSAHPLFVDAANTASVSVVVDTQPAQVTNLSTTGTNPACTADANNDGGATCTFSIAVNAPNPAAPGNTFTITTLDASGNQLSTDTFQKQIPLGQNTTISATLTGIAASLSVTGVIATSGPAGTKVVNGVTYVVMAPPTTSPAIPQVSVMVTQLDADGTVIFGGNPLTATFTALAGFPIGTAPNTFEVSSSSASEIVLQGPPNAGIAAAVTLSVTNPTGSTPATATPATFDLFSEGAPPPYTASFGPFNGAAASSTLSVQLVPSGAPQPSGIPVTLTAANSTAYLGPANYSGFACPAFYPVMLTTVDALGVSNVGLFGPNGDTITINTFGAVGADLCGPGQLFDFLGDGPVLTVNLTDPITISLDFGSAGTLTGNTLTLAPGQIAIVNFTQAVNTNGNFLVQNNSCPTSVATIENGSVNVVGAGEVQSVPIDGIATGTCTLSGESLNALVTLNISVQ